MKNFVKLHVKAYILTINRFLISMHTGSRLVLY